MTVYVDDMRADFKPQHRSDRPKFVMSHMIADTEAELHDMADRIGVARRWFQGDHYDVTQSKRAEALKLGAQAITWREAGQIMLGHRKAAADAARAADPRARAVAVAGDDAVRAVLARFPGAAIVAVRWSA